MTITRALVMSMLALLAASAAFAVDYWPVGDGMILNYNNGSVMTTALGADPQTVWYHENRNGVVTSTRFRVPADGDVYVLGGITAGGIAWSLPVPYKFLDLPLYPTKTWSIVYGAEGGDNAANKAPQAWVRGRCNDFSSLQTALGLYYFYEVTISGIHPDIDGTWWVNETYGPVRLPSGATLSVAVHAVPTEAQAWGAVKALFR